MPRDTPIRPSPHRFRSAQHGPAAASTAPQVPTNFRQQTHDDHPIDDGSQHQVHRPNQFAAVPKFSKALIGRSQHLPGPTPKASIAQALQLSKRSADVVEEADAVRGCGELPEHESELGVQTSAAEGPALESNLQSLPFSPKRRRLDDDDAPVDDFPLQDVKLKEGPRAPHFMHLRGERAPPQVKQDSAVCSSRPAFVRHTVHAEQTHEPLPETFSPHKRGSRFLAGGLAATVQQWVVETGQAALATRRGTDYLHGEDYLERIKVDHAIGSMPLVIDGTLVDRSPVKVLLSGKGAADNERRSIKSGSMIGLRSPIWDLQIDETIWLVAVDWRRLS